MTRMKRIAFIGIAVLAVLTAHLFLFGKMFAYSPVTIGFEKHELANSIIYTQRGVSFDDFERIDSLITPVEKFHDLKYLKKPEVFLFSDSISFIRRSLSKARFCTFYNGRIFVTPRALREALRKEISLEIYLTHELSHTLLHQHSGLINAAKYPKWLVEGIAVYSSDQMGTSFYPGKSDTYSLIRAGNYMPPDFFKTRKEDGIRLNVENRIPFMYSEFGCMVDYLISSYGKERFLIYMKSLIKKHDHDKIFLQTYGINFDEFLMNFKEHVDHTDNLHVKR